MGMEVILFDGAESFEQTGNTLLTKGPMWNLVKIAILINEQIFNSPLTEGSIWTVTKTGPGVSEKLFKGVDG